MCVVCRVCVCVFVWWFLCSFACLLVCVCVCFVCLLVCLFACLLACLLAWLLGWLVGLAWLSLVCCLVDWPACLPACQSVVCRYVCWLSVFPFSLSLSPPLCFCLPFFFRRSVLLSFCLSVFVSVCRSVCRLFLCLCCMFAGLVWLVLFG